MSDSPYSPPSSDVNGSQSLSVDRIPDWAAALGVALFACPLVGFMGACYWAWSAIKVILEKSAADPQDFANLLRGPLVLVLSSFVAGICGFFYIQFALLVHKNRQTWFFYCSIGLAFFYSIVIFPLGLLPGILIAILFVPRRPEFFERG